MGRLFRPHLIQYNSHDSLTMIKCLLHAIEEKTGLHMEQNHDFTQLSELIFTTLHEHISSSTLKRIWNYVKPMGVTPRTSTLNILARFLGFRNFEEFSKLGGNFVSRRNHRSKFGIVCSLLGFKVVGQGCAHRGALAAEPSLRVSPH